MSQNPKNPSQRLIEYEVDGKQYVCEEGVIAALLDEGVCYVSGSDPHATIFVGSNDIFYWGTADGDDLPTSEIANLYWAWKADSKWGSTKWCAKQRNLRPQWPIARDMIADGAWDESMNA